MQEQFRTPKTTRFLALTLLALVAVLRLKLGMAAVLGGAALAGVALTLLG